MAAPAPHNTPPVAGPITSLSVLLARVFWMMMGPMLMLILLYAIVTGGGGWITRWDIVYLIVIPLLVLCRWIDVRSGAASDSNGAVAGPEQLHRYARFVVPLGATLWVLANVFGNHILS
jgi:hypothetical protein